MIEILCKRVGIHILVASMEVADLHESLATWDDFIFHMENLEYQKNLNEALVDQF